MNDMIYRQDAIDAIEDDSSKGHYSCFASYSDAQKFKQIVNELPSAEPIDMQDKCDGCFYFDWNGSTCEFCARNYPDRFSARTKGEEE